MLFAEYIISKLAKVRIVLFQVCLCTYWQEHLCDCFISWELLFHPGLLFFAFCFLEALTTVSLPHTATIHSLPPAFLPTQYPCKIVS